VRDNTMKRSIDHVDGEAAKGDAAAIEKMLIDQGEAADSVQEKDDIRIALAIVRMPPGVYGISFSCEPWNRVTNHIILSSGTCGSFEYEPCSDCHIGADAMRYICEVFTVPDFSHARVRIRRMRSTEGTVVTTFVVLHAELDIGYRISPEKLLFLSDVSDDLVERLVFVHKLPVPVDGKAVEVDVECDIVLRHEDARTCAAV